MHSPLDNLNRTQTGSHNSDNASVAADRLRNFIDRVERLEEEKKAISEDISEVYSEAKGEGYDAKILRAIVRIRKMDKADYQEQEAILDLYLTALGEK